MAAAYDIFNGYQFCVVFFDMVYWVEFTYMRKGKKKKKKFSRQTVLKQRAYHALLLTLCVSVGTQHLVNVTIVLDLRMIDETIQSFKPWRIVWAISV